MVTASLPPGSSHTLARGLGWFSIGLGVLELVAPHSLARALGMEERAELIRAYGMREVATGLGILSQADPTPWVWGRVGGDLLDLATLATGLDGANPHRDKVGLALAAVAGVTVLDVICAQSLASERAWARRPVRDYSDRRGMPAPPAAMRGAARDFEVPPDMRIPEPLRPYATASA